MTCSDKYFFQKGVAMPGENKDFEAQFWINTVV